MSRFGVKKSKLGTEYLFDKCQYCETSGNLKMNIFQKYFHIIGIPTFPVGKTAETECDHCRKLVPKDNFTDTAIQTFSSAKSKFKTPIWMFSGIAVGLILYFGIQTMQKKTHEESLKYLEAPKVGDIYNIYTEDRNYTFYKVDKIKGDTISLLAANYQSDKRSGLISIRLKKDIYNDVVFSVLKSDLKPLLEKGTILDVERTKE